MILGRSPNLYVSVIAALLNVLVILGVWPLTGEQVAAVNFLAVALVGLIAGSDRVQLANAVAAQARVDAKTAPKP